MTNIKAIYDLRRVIELTKARLVRYPASKDLLDYIDERVDAIECEIDELQESWAQEAREHADDSARLAELAHENAELKREIAERYMKLPEDADGVPIHCGDRMRLDNGHEGEVWLIGAQDIMMSDHTCFDWARSRHVKPRTIEDVLHDFWEEWESHPTDAEWSVRLKRLRESEVKYADEIREVLGVEK